MKKKKRKTPCPSCGKKSTRILSVYHSRTTNGVRYKRLCKSCDHRWTTWRGRQPERGLHVKRPCPACGSLHSSIRTTYRSKTTNGVRRLIVCAQCQHKWNVWQGVKPDPSQYQKRPQRQRVTEDQVRLVLTTRGTSQLEISRMIGKSRATVQKILNGELYAELAPELPRFRHKASRSCRSCSNHRQGTCLMNVPDFRDEGEFFAVDCDLYSRRKGAKPMPR